MVHAKNKVDSVELPFTNISSSLFIRTPRSSCGRKVDI